MLSILRRQSLTLEKELLESRQALEALRRTQAEHDALIASKNERIAELEKELSGRRPLEEVILCRACGRPADEEIDPVSDTIAVDTVLKGLDELKKRLRSTESKLTQSELEKSLAELQLLTHTSKLRRDLTRELEGARAAAREAAAKAAKALQAAKAAERKAADELAAGKIAVAELQAGLKRRDEQVEFLMQVHDASQVCEWVPTNESTADGSSHGGGCAGSILGGSGSAAFGATATSIGCGGAFAAGGLGTDRSWRSAEVAAALGARSSMSCDNNNSYSPSGMAARSPAVRAAVTLGSWQCRACTLRNDASRTMCEACGADR